ncbi:hypothetical protein THAOC_21005, partial [Thalassiosira oceanica]
MKYSSNVVRTGWTGSPCRPDAYASLTAAHFSQPPQPWPADPSDNSLPEIFGATTSSRCSTISPGPDPRPVLKAHDDSSVPERIPNNFPTDTDYLASQRLHAISRKDRAREDEIYLASQTSSRGSAISPGPQPVPKAHMTTMLSLSDIRIIGGGFRVLHDQVKTLIITFLRPAGVEADEESALWMLGKNKTNPEGTIVADFVARDFPVPTQASNDSGLGARTDVLGEVKTLQPYQNLIRQGQLPDKQA